ncbi:hypothetical protein C7S13_4655 [Burkholderia cepacia]|nr:hypothetical protein [Burkholderia cepacia]
MNLLATDMTTSDAHPSLHLEHAFTLRQPSFYVVLDAN